ncbi:MAG: hypothetical protein WDM90_04030 [Ferruginibacter sp.]
MTKANNIKWAKVMKAAGVKIIYSIPKLKVHAKVALVKKKQNGRQVYIGLFATGNLNENTARFLYRPYFTYRQWQYAA